MHPTVSNTVWISCVNDLLIWYPALYASKSSISSSPRSPDTLWWSPLSSSVAYETEEGDSPESPSRSVRRQFITSRYGRRQHVSIRYCITPADSVWLMPSVARKPVTKSVFSHQHGSLVAFCYLSLRTRGTCESCDCCDKRRALYHAGRSPCGEHIIKLLKLVQQLLIIVKALRVGRTNTHERMYLGNHNQCHGEGRHSFHPGLSADLCAT